MRKRLKPDIPPRALAVFQPAPSALYSLDAAARLARVPRRTLLLYCRAGLVRPVVQTPLGVMEFAEEAIQAVRQIEHLRSAHGLDLAWIKTLLELAEEVARLRAEVRFLRGH
jgi:DNA-binding transcriptional MerR regulator